MENGPDGIFKKVLALQEAVQQFKKDASNSHFKYSYSSAEGVNERIKAELVKQGIVAQLQVEATMVVGNVLVATAHLRLIDPIDGSSLTFKSIGSGTDNGDKHAMKAATAAQKYATIAAVFGSTSDDPEADSSTDKPKPSSVARKDNSVYGGGPKAPAARQAQQSQLQDKALTDETFAVVITDIKGYPDRVGRQPFKIDTEQGTFQNFDRKVIDSIDSGSIVVYKVTKYGNDIIEVKNGEAEAQPTA